MALEAPMPRREAGAIGTVGFARGK